LKVIKKLVSGGMSIVFALLLIALILGASWGAMVGIVYLLSLCFGFQFNLLIATGVWLIVLVLRYIISAARGSDN
jgi:hypothetical protein